MIYQTDAPRKNQKNKKEEGEDEEEEEEEKDNQKPENNEPRHTIGELYWYKLLFFSPIDLLPFSFFFPLFFFFFFSFVYTAIMIAKRWRIIMAKRRVERIKKARAVIRRSVALNFSVRFFPFSR